MLSFATSFFLTLTVRTNSTGGLELDAVDRDLARRVPIRLEVGTPGE